MNFTPGDPRNDLPDQEIIVDRNITVDVCLRCMINKAGYNGNSCLLLMTLTFTSDDPRCDLLDQEILVGRNISVCLCLQCMIIKTGNNCLLVMSLTFTP